MDSRNEIFDRARLARDPRFDGKFFVGVKTTGIYCRPICPVHPAQSRNVRFFLTAAAAARAGFRPCLRCRPELAPSSPAWNGTAATVSRALALIERGFLDEQGVEALAEALGMGTRHLRRLFRQHVGVTPREVARTRRVQTAKRLLDATAMPITDIAYAAGFSSLRRFNAVFSDAYGRPPSSMRRESREPAGGETGIALSLAYRPPLNWPLLARMLADEATPGIEEVTTAAYRRTFAFDGEPGWLEIRPLPHANQLSLNLSLPNLRRLREVIERIRILFDLRADPAEISAQLGTNLALRRYLEMYPGLRLPGAWDGFEVAARAIIAQDAGVELAGPLLHGFVRAYGKPALPCATGKPLRLFPTPADFADIRTAGHGVGSQTVRCLRSLGRRTAEGSISFDGRLCAPELVEALRSLGLRTPAAHWVVLRSLGEPDMIPFGSANVPHLEALGVSSSDQEAWRPWRSYAAIMLMRRAGHLPRKAAATGEQISLATNSG